MHNVVRIQSLNAKLPKELGELALATGDAACQCDAHAGYFASGAGVTGAAGAAVTLVSSLRPIVF